MRFVAFMLMLLGLAILAAALCSSAHAQQFLFFTQDGCGPCQQMKKNVLPGLTAEGFKFDERNANTDPLAAKLNLKTTPTFVAINNAGKTAGMIVGATTAAELRRIAVKPVALPTAATQPAVIDRDTIKVELGRKLFFDSRLSLDNSTSCASCHNPALGYSDGRPVAVGLIGANRVGKNGVRNSPTVLSVGKQGRQFWDGRAANLEEQALGPIANPAEMGNQTVGQVMQRLRTIPGYRTLFGQAFGRDVNQQDFGSALAAFERTLVATNAPIDRYLAGDSTALSEPAERGYQVAAQSRCFDCHQVKNDFRGTFANNGYSARTSLKDKGLAAAVINGVTQGNGQNNQNLRAFKVPTLRELPLTGPYMHDGGLRTLADVVAHYAGGGRFNSNGQLARDAVIDQRVAAISLSTDQQRDLLAFLSEAFTGDYPRVDPPAVFP